MQILDFIMTHIVKKENRVDLRDKNNGDGHQEILSEREILKDGKAVTRSDLEGKSKDEVLQILSDKLGIEMRSQIDEP